MPIYAEQMHNFRIWQEYFWPILPVAPANNRGPLQLHGSVQRRLLRCRFTVGPAEVGLGRVLINI
jgi:hypothetical protein